MAETPDVPAGVTNPPIFIICRMVGNGTENDPLRPYIYDHYRVSWVAVGKSGKGALVFVKNPTPELEADPQVTVLSRDLTAKFERNEWNAVANKFKDYGLSPAEYDPNRTIRDTIIMIGTQYEPAFNIDNFFVR